jgi:predicted RNase H-like HicB family nuclease
MATLQFTEEQAQRLEAVHSTADVHAQREETLRLLALKPRESVIDVGCGPGSSASASRYNKGVRTDTRRLIMARYAIVVFWSEEDGAWIADVPDLKSCSAFGATPEEAVAEVRVAMDAWLAAAQEAGHAPEVRFQSHHEAAE